MFLCFFHKDWLGQLLLFLSATEGGLSAPERVYCLLEVSDKKLGTRSSSTTMLPSRKRLGTSNSKADAGAGKMLVTNCYAGTSVFYSLVFVCLFASAWAQRRTNYNG